MNEDRSVVNQEIPESGTAIQINKSSVTINVYHAGTEIDIDNKEEQ